MKILQIPFHYYPEAVGGTEVYVSSLAKRLAEQGIEVEIAAPGDTRDQYVHDGIVVHRFGITKTPADIAMLYGQGDPVAAREFADIIDKSRPDIVHLHAMSPAVSLAALKKVKEYGLPVVFTCHIPGITCQRGTLLHYGTGVCDGVWGLQKCTACTLQGRGLPVGLATLLSGVPESAGHALSALGIRNSIVTALRMRELQAGRRRALVNFFGATDRVVAVSAWLLDMLVANGVPRAKIFLCRHGSSQQSCVAANADTVAASFAGNKSNEMKLAFLGRLNPAKGVHILVEAMRLRPQIRMTLDIFGIVQDDLAYVNQLRKHITNDSRIHLREPLLNDDVADRLRAYDALAVPSQGMETGPLVVYDAFLAGIPVIGSRRGGISELVTHDRDGLLVDACDPEAWAKNLELFSLDMELRKRLRYGVRPPRTMSAVASEMLDLYAEVTSTVKSVYYA